MAISKQNLIRRLEDDTSSDENEADNIESFYDFLSAVKQYNLNRINKILQKVSNITNLVTKQDKNQKNNTCLHIALMNIKEGTNHEKVNEVIKCLIDNGALVEIENDKKETPLDVLEKCSRKVTNFKWETIRNFLQLEERSAMRNNTQILVKSLVQQRTNRQPSECMIVNESRMPEYFKTTQGAKRTLHGYTYQLKIIMLFVQRIPDGQKFFMATEMDEAHKFDDVVLKYQEDKVWKYRFVQVKHKHEEEYEIKINDLFNIDGKQQSDSPYFINNYFDSFCKIATEEIFNDGIKEEFLLCTNIDFSKCAKSYFERIEDRDDLILGHSAVKYKLSNEKIEELKKILQIHCTNENYFLEFIQKFRFLVKFKDNIINTLINETLGEYLKIKNTDIATTYIQDKLLKWFESYKNKESKFLQIEDKNKFLKSLNNTIRSLLVAGYSSVYIKGLNSYKFIFDNPLPELKCILPHVIGLSVLITLSPKISIIKLSQMINKNLMLKQDEVIFLPSSILKSNKELINIFYHDQVYQWLVIECERGEKIDMTILNDILKATQTKKIIIIGLQEDVKNLSADIFHDTGSSFKILDEVSQNQLLTRQVNFQGREMSLDQLINRCSAEEIIDDIILEELMEYSINIGDDLREVNVLEDYYISRTLLKKYLDPQILQDEDILKKSCFFITGASKKNLVQLHVKPEWISAWKENVTFEKGIVIIPENTLNHVEFLKLYQQRENVYWIEYINGEFFFNKNVNSRLNLPGTSLQEDHLSTKEILDFKIMIIADQPGFGKTSFIRRSAYNLKKIMPEIWVLQIDLASCTSSKRKSLKDISFMEGNMLSAVDFLVDFVFWSYEGHRKTISKKILLEALKGNDKENKKYPKIIILFDGFDEISPDFKEETLTLLKALKNSNVTQMWITTRTCEELSLEKALDSSALHLKPINEMEKQKFSIEFWKYNLNEERQSVPDLFLEMGAQRLSRDFDNDDKLFDFTDNPLHLTMLAEVILKKIILPKKYGEWNNIKLPHLYKEFLNIKLEKIYYNDKQPNHSIPDRERFEYTLPGLKKYLQEISFMILFSQGTIQFDKTNDSTKLAKRAGLLVLYDDYLQFVHRSFAEYFLCDYFVENFDSENISKLIFTVLTDNNYQLIRTFLNDNHLFLEKLRSKPLGILNIISQTSVKSHIYRMAEEENYNLIINYFQNIPSNIVRKLVLFDINDKRETIMHYICRKIQDEKMFIELLNSIQNSVSNKTLKTLLFKKNEEKKTVFHLIIFQYFDDLCIKKFKILLDIIFRCLPKTFYSLLCQVDQLGNTVLHDACLKNVIHFVTEILESVKDKPKILKGLLIKVNNGGQNALHCIVNKLISSIESFSWFQKLLSFIQKICGSEFFGNMLLRGDYAGNTVLHLACRRRDHLLVKNLLESVRDIPHVLQRLLFQTNREKQSILHCIFPTGSEGFYRSLSEIYCLKEISNIITLNLNSTLLHRLLLQSDINGNTILNIACMAASNESVSHLLKAVEDHPKVSKIFLLKSNRHRQSIFHSIFFSVYKNQINMTLILKEILHFITVQFSSEILYEVLSQVDYHGHTALHFAFILWSRDGVTCLLEELKNNSELLMELILKTNRKGQNIIHCIFSRAHDYQQVFDRRSMILDMVLDLVTTHFDKEMLYHLLLQADETGNTSLHFACTALSIRCVDILIKVVKDNTNILQKYLLKTNSKGQNILHCIFVSKKFSFENLDSKNIILGFLVNVIKSNINCETLQNLLLQSDNEGNTVLHVASIAGSSTCIFPLLEAANNNSDVSNKLLLKTNRNRQNVLHCILFPYNHFAIYDYDKIGLMVELVRNFIANHYNLDLLYALLLQADNDGNTTLHFACMIHANKVISDLLKAVKGNHKILSKLLLKPNLQGQTALHSTFILKFSYSFIPMAMILQEIVEFLSDYDTQILYTLLLQADNQGNTALHIACRLRSNQLVASLFEAVKENTEVLNELILKKNCCGRSALHYTILIYKVDVLYIDKKLNEEDATQYFLQLVRRYCDYEVLKKLLLQTDTKKNTLLNMACQSIPDETSIYYQKKFLFQTSKIKDVYRGKTVINPYIPRLHILFDFINAVCPEILSEIIYHVVNTRTILLIICNGIYRKNDNLNEEDQNEWEDLSDEVVNADDEEALAQKINLDILSNFLGTIKNNTDLVNKLLLITDYRGQTALHYTVNKFDNPCMFKVLFEFVKSNCQREILKELLYKSDENGCTILHLACQKNKKMLTCVVYALEDMNEPLGDFLLIRDKYERTALDRVLCNSKREIIPQTLFNWWNKHTIPTSVSEKLNK